MFVPAIKTNLSDRSRALLAAARTLLIVEHDSDVDWEVDQEPLRTPEHPHRERLATPWRVAHRRRPGQTPAREQVCLSPLPGRDGHRRATPDMQAIAPAGSAERRSGAQRSVCVHRLAS